MIRIRTLILVLSVSLLAACATIPQESVGLSAKIGVGLQKQHQSQIDLINLYFSIKRGNLDQAMSRALDRYFETITPSGSITLNRKQLQELATDVMSSIQTNNAAKEELEKARIFLIKKLNENYLMLNQANASITGLLQSAVTVRNTRSDAYKKLSQATGGTIDLDKAFSILDDFTLKNGGKAGKGIKLVEKLESLLKKRGVTNE